MTIPDLRVQDLADPDLAPFLERAKGRLEEAILCTIVSRGPEGGFEKEDIELLSFPIAVMLAVATDNSFIKRRYALAEANGAYEELLKEPKEKLLEFSRNYEWKLAPNSQISGTPYEFELHFTDYLRNITHLREKEWKLVNRPLSAGKVFLMQNHVARLLKEEIRRDIEKRLEISDIPSFPQEVIDVAEEVKKLSAEKIGEAEMSGFPKVVVQTAFPPCVNALYQAFSSGRHLSHIGRFTLTSFLINVGMPTETVIELFKSISDFNERMTRYQVEHIAGDKGSRTRYTPPSCDTLRTHGVCTSPDDLCRRIRHPLSYYRSKTRQA
jgi:DNA primase large subunit